DVNDNVPFFTSSIYEASVTEGAQIGTSVLQVSAHDKDLGLNGQITYTLLSDSSGDHSLFRIDPELGIIYTEAVFDREARSSYLLEVQSEDGQESARPGKNKQPNSDTAYVRVFISDVNDNKPVFAQRLYEVGVDEDADVGLAVVTVSATDEDEGANAKLRYQITSGNKGGVFDIEPEVGTIFVAQPLDYEQQKRYKLLVLASDGRWEDYAAIVVTVVNKNDEAPVFSMNEYYGSVTEELDGSPVFVLQIDDENDNAPEFASSSHLLPPLPEDVPVGTSIIQVVATDTDSGLNGEILYSILPQSDPHGHFATAGTPALTASVTVHLLLLDTNDNGPELETAYAPVLWENSPAPQVVWLNQSSTLLHVVDRDSPENGPPYYLSLPSLYSVDFHLQDHGNGSAMLTALRMFDRERQSEFHLPVIMVDSGDPPMTATNTLTITIGDQNDNAHQAGEKDVYVHSRKGRVGNAALGKVYAPDPDDWDNKTYTLETSAAKYFSLNQSSGELTIRQNAPAGSYWLRVGVSDGVWPDVISGIRVHVRDLEEKAVLSSASLRLTGLTARDFIDSRIEGKSRLETFWDFLSETLSVRTGSINIFSVADREQKTVDVHFYVLAENGYLHPEKLHAVLAAHKRKLQSLLRVNVSQVEVDECVHADCRASGGCFTQLSVSNSPSLLDSGALSLVSVKVTPVAVCGCAAREMTYRICASYPGNPCLNGGTCMDTKNGYRCHCPPQFDGPDCQQTRLSFLGNGYAWLPPIRPCFDSHLSLEFMTDEDDGLLLYAGPLATLLPGDTEDYMAIELIGGTPSLKMNHGSGTLVLQLNHNIGVANGRWHRLDVRSNSKLYDLGSPAEASNTVPGCTLIDGHCTDGEPRPPCGLRGHCHSHWGSYSCLCQPGFTGPQCDRVQQSSPVLSQVIQGLLAVFYNLGDGDYNLTLPHQHLSDGEWHELELDRYGREFTLRLDGGGGRREVTASRGQGQEIVVDPTTVMLGNSFPSGHNHSFLGCMRDLRFNGHSIPLDPEQTSDRLQVVAVQGVSPGCSSEACRQHQCSPPLVCVDLWRHHECRCPPGHITRETTQGKVCMYTLCASRPCRHGTCVAHSPSRYSCHCSEGYRGRHCEVTLAMFHNEDNNSLSLSSMFAISICVMAFLVLMLGLFLYSCWRRHKGLKEGVYHVSAHHGEWEDIRENVLNYDEEGGGEQDQNAFNMVELQRSLQPSPAQSLRYSYPHSIISYPQTKPPKNNSKKVPTNWNGSSAIALRLAIPPSETETLPSPLTFRRSQKSFSFSSQDLALYLCEVIRDMEHPQQLGTMTTPRRTSGKERRLAAVRSLSSLSASQGSEARPQATQGTRLDRLKTLRAVVGDLRGESKTPESQKDKLKESKGQLNCEKSG
ncbi:unnamed protein product, partial [Tetraodon nigroviridis]